MPPIIAFIGWHNSGKTTLSTQVVRRLKEKNYRVGVIKSTKERDILTDQPGTDTDNYTKAGADGVILRAPDQLFLHTAPLDLDLQALAHRFFAEMDIVIAEGFKQAPAVAKIEVRRDPQAPLLKDQVEGVLALATDQHLPGVQCFALGASQEIADFIESQFLAGWVRPEVELTLVQNGKACEVSEALRQQLVAAIGPLLAHVSQEQQESCTELSLRWPKH